MAQGDVTTKQLDGKIHMIKKANKPDTQLLLTVDPILQEDEFQSLYFTPNKNTNVIVEPPFNPLQLASLIHRNNILAQCVTAMEVNIDGSGYTFDLLEGEKDTITGDDPSLNGNKNKTNSGNAKDDNPSGLPQNLTKVSKFAPPPKQPKGGLPPKPPEQAQTPSGDDPTQIDPSAGNNPPDLDTPQDEPIDPELEMLEHFFKEPFPGMSFTTMRRKLRIDMEATGNGYIEVIRNLAGEIVFLRYIEAVSMRLVKLDAPTNVEVTVTRGGKAVSATMPMRERRFAYKIGAHLVYYREFGSSRQINKKTGSWIEKDAKDNKNPDILGSEILHFTVVKDFRTHYGLPRWINQLPSILGSRKSEEFNLEFFDAGGLPPAIIFVQGGALVSGVKDQLQNYLSGKASSKHRAAIVEVMSTSGSLDSAGSVSVKTERFGASLSDSMFQKYDESCGEHVRKSFRLPKILVGDTDVMNRACYSDDTETLTDHGWITWDKYTTNMKIATIDTESMELKYSYPHGKKVLVYDVSNIDMYHFKTAVTDILVTPEHRMFFASNDRNSWRIAPVEQMIKLSRVNFKNTISEYCGGKTIKTLQLPTPSTEVKAPINLGGQEVPMDIFLEFLGYWLSEGSAPKDITWKGVVSVCQGKEENLPIMQKCFEAIEACGINVKLNILHGEKAAARNRKPISSWKIRNHGLREFLITSCGGDSCYNKRIPSFIRGLPVAQLRILFDALMLGDGSIDVRENRKALCYYTTSKELADDVQEIAFKLGYRANIRTSTQVGKRLIYRVLMSYDSPVARIDIRGATVNMSRPTYTGKVYCFSVSTGVFVTRRNGKIAIQGNTADAALQAAENQVFQPERFHFDEMINTTVVKALGAKKYVMRSLNMTLADPQMQMQALGQAWNLIEGKDFVDVANEISGLDMKYSAKAEAANKPPTAPAMGGDPMGGGDPNMGDPNGDPAMAPGSDDGSGGNYDMSQPAGNQNMGTPQQPIGMQGDPNAGAELGQAPGGAGQGYTQSLKSERMSPMDIVKLTGDWAVVMGLVAGEASSDAEVIIHKVNTLKSEDRTLFDSILVKKMFPKSENMANWSDREILQSCDHSHE